MFRCIAYIKQEPIIASKPGDLALLSRIVILIRFAISLSDPLGPNSPADVALGGEPTALLVFAIVFCQGLAKQLFGSGMGVRYLDLYLFVLTSWLHAFKVC